MLRICRQNPKPNTELRNGTAAVEFAMLAPLYITLTLGTIEFGNALNRQNILASSLREGGRLAAMEWDDVLQPGQTANQKSHSGYPEPAEGQWCARR